LPRLSDRIQINCVEYKVENVIPSINIDNSFAYDEKHPTESKETFPPLLIARAVKESNLEQEARK